MKKLDKETKLEKAILNWLALKNPTITKQIREVIVTDREYSGAGFFFHFSVPANVAPLDKEIKTIPGPAIKTKQLPNGADSILFCKDGYIDMLEVYGYDDFFPEDINDFKLGEGQ